VRLKTKRKNSKLKCNIGIDEELKNFETQQEKVDNGERTATFA